MATKTEGIVTPADLTDISDADYHKRRGEFLLCQVCGAETGIGTRGDYFTRTLNYPFTCPQCGNADEIYLAKRVTKTVRV